MIMFKSTNKVNRIRGFLKNNNNLFFSTEQKQYKYTNSTNLYKVLGLQQDATSKEIKIAYYQLAKQYHPDKNTNTNANEIFGKITQAYEVLSDENKKKLYDACGVDEEEVSESYQSNSQRFKNRNKYQQQRSKDKEDLFNDFDQFFQSKNSKKVNPPQKGDDIHQTINISFQESINENKEKIFKEISYNRDVKCPSCKGTRCAKNTFPSKCYTCGGSGVLIYRDKFETVEHICDNCEGYGKVIRNKCSTCKGEGQINENHVEKIKIIQGVENGQVFRKQGEGNVGQNGGKNGDLFIKINVDQDPYFKRKGKNIHTDFFLNPSEAYLGGTFNIKTLYNKEEGIDVQLDRNVTQNQKVQLTNHGLKIENQKYQGDHIVNLQIKIPLKEDLSKEQIEIYKKIREIEKKIESQSKQNQGQQYYSQNNNNSNNQKSQSFDKYYQQQQF